MRHQPEGATERLLVCVDLQAGSNTQHARNSAHPWREVLAYARQSAWSVAHVFRRARGNGTPRPLRGVEPLPSEPVLVREGLSAFSSPDFDRLLERRGRPELVLLGGLSSSSVLATALIAHTEHLAVTIVSEVEVVGPRPANENEVEAFIHAVAPRFATIVGPRELLRRPRFTVIEGGC